MSTTTAFNNSSPSFFELFTRRSTGQTSADGRRHDKGRPSRSGPEYWNSLS